MPGERRYNKGSIIYFENDMTREIYVLKFGRVDISFTEPQTGEKITRTLNQGEFFGLKSAIIGHTRDEMAESVTESVVVVFATDEFERFVAGKVELMKRLLRVLSNQIRNLGIKVNNYLSNNVVYPPNIGLFKIGEYYLNNKKYNQAIQVYERYIKAYPDTHLTEEAQFRIDSATEAKRTGFLKPFKPVDEIIQSGAEGQAFGVADAKADISNTHSKLGLKEFMNSYYKAEGYYNGGEYTKAESEFKELFKIDSKIISVDLRHKARFLYVQTLYHLHKFSECVREISSFIKSIKDPTMIKNSLFVLSAIYGETGNKQGVMAILQKIVKLAPIDELSKKAKSQLEQLKA